MDNFYNIINQYIAIGIVLAIIIISGFTVARRNKKSVNPDMPKKK